MLLKNYWKISPELITNDPEYSNLPDRETAFVQIGDRTFGKKDKFLFVYDLAAEWEKFTGLPFVFAAWIANKPIPQTFIDEFNESLKYGLQHREALFAEIPARPDFDIHDYLMNKIDFDLNESKKEALHLFLEYLKAV